MSQENSDILNFDYNDIKQQIIQDKIKNDAENKKKYEQSLIDEKKKFVDEIKTKRILEIEKLVEAETTLINQQDYYKLKEEEFKIKQIELEKKRIKDKYEMNIYNDKFTLQNIILKLFFWFVLIYIIYLVCFNFQSILSNSILSNLLN